MTAGLLDALKDLGFHYATRAGFTVGIDDVRIPPEKDEIIARYPARKWAQINGNYRNGVITEGERYNKVIDTWTRTTTEVRAGHLFERLARTTAHGFNPIYMMADSGARGIQRADPPAGRHARPDGQAAEEAHRRHWARSSRRPIIRELPRRPDRAGVLHLDARRPQGSGRHGAEDRRRRLPDAPPGGRGPGRHHQRGRTAARSAASRSARSRRARRSSSRCATASLGRVAAEDVVDPITGDVLVEAGERDHRRGDAPSGSTRRRASRQVEIRSVLTCEARRGVCAQVLRPQPGHRHAWWTSARPSASSPPSPSASRARSSRCAPSTSAASPAASSSSREVQPSTTARCKLPSTLDVVRRQAGRHRGHRAATARSAHRRRQGRVRPALQRALRRHLLVQDGDDGQARATSSVEWDPYNDADRGRARGRCGSRTSRKTSPCARRWTSTTGLAHAGHHRGPRQGRCTRHVDIIDAAGQRARPLPAARPGRTSRCTTAQEIERRRRAGQDPPRDRQGRATSPAVCRAWPSCSRPAARRTPPSSPRSTARVEFGGRDPRHAQGHRPTARTARSRST